MKKKFIIGILLIFICIFAKSKYFFVPIQLSLITVCTIGIPSFVLALEPNEKLVEGKKFLTKIILRSLPGGITVFLNILIILLCKVAFHLDDSITNTLCVFLTAVTGFIHLYNICSPFNKWRVMLFTSLVLIFSYASIFQNRFFSISDFNLQILIIFMLLFFFTKDIYFGLKRLINYILSKSKL